MTHEKQGVKLNPIPTAKVVRSYRVNNHWVAFGARWTDYCPDSLMKVTQIQTEPFDALLAQAAHPALASEIPNPSDRTNKDYSLLISLKTSLHLPEKILSTKICCSDMPLSRELHDEFLGKYLV